MDNSNSKDLFSIYIINRINFWGQFFRHFFGALFLMLLHFGQFSKSCFNSANLNFRFRVDYQYFKLRYLLFMYYRSGFIKKK